MRLYYCIAGVDRFKKTEIVEKMKAIGGREWKSDGHHKIYFNSGILAKIVGLDYSHYINTGKIYSASLNGKPIQINQANEILRSFKSFSYNVNDNHFSVESCEICETAVNAIRALLGITED